MTRGRKSRLVSNRGGGGVVRDSKAPWKGPHFSFGRPGFDSRSALEINFFESLLIYSKIKFSVD